MPGDPGHDMSGVQNIFLTVNSGFRGSYAETAENDEKYFEAVWRKSGV